MFNEDPYQKAFDTFLKDKEQLFAISDRLVAGLKSDNAELLKIQSAIKRRKPTKKDENAVRDLEAKYKTFAAQKAKVIDGVKDAENRLYAAWDAADEEFVTRICALAAYPGPGGGQAGFSYLLAECKDYAALKGNYEARRAKKSEIYAILSSVVAAIGTQHGVKMPDNSILAEFESIENPERASQFYREHRDVIHVQMQAKQDANQPKS